VRNNLEHYRTKSAGNNSTYAKRPPKPLNVKLPIPPYLKVVGILRSFPFALMSAPIFGCKYPFTVLCLTSRANYLIASLRCPSESFTRLIGFRWGKAGAVSVTTVDVFSFLFLLLGPRPAVAVFPRQTSLIAAQPRFLMPSSYECSCHCNSYNIMLILCLIILKCDSDVTGSGATLNKNNVLTYCASSASWPP